MRIRPFLSSLIHTSGKYRVNQVKFKPIGDTGIPRLLDLGQCNDSYSGKRPFRPKNTICCLVVVCADYILLYYHMTVSFCAFIDSYALYHGDERCL